MSATLDPRAAAPLAIHATAVLVGETGLLIRGRSGAGKSSLAEAILAEAALCGRFARLVGDDRIRLVVAGGRLVARPHPRIAGLIERRGEGIVRVASEPAAVIRFVVDLGGPQGGADHDRMPPAADRRIVLQGVALPRLRLAGSAPPHEQARRALAALES